ncbi:MAG: PAS domain S-box protein [Spirochaetota bacterium]
MVQRRYRNKIVVNNKLDERLKRSALEWQTTFDAMNDGVMLLDREGKILRCNRAAIKLTGKSPSEILGLTCGDVFKKDMFTSKFLKEKISRSRRLNFTFKFGNKWIKTSVDPVLDREGNLTSAVLVISDITSHRRYQKKAREERERAQKFLDIAGVIILFLGADGKVKLINKKGCEILGYAEKEVIGKNWFDNFIPARIRSNVLNVFKDIKQGRLHEYVENYVLTRNGEERLIAWYNTVVTDSRGKLIGTLSSGGDITERKRAEDELERERNLLRTLIDSFPDAIYIKDRESRFVVANTSIGKIMGVEDPDELIGKTDFDFYPEKNASAFYEDEKEILKTGKPIINKEESLVDGEGNERWILTTKVPLVESGGVVTGVIGIGRDITEQKRAEEKLHEKERQLLHAQKMEAVGRLAGGIAHDFNNILTAIIGYADYLLMKGISGDESIRNYIEEIKKAGFRAAGLTRQLLAFSRRQVLAPKVVDLRTIIKNLENMLKQLIGEDIDFRVEVDETPMNIMADESQIEQIIVNLVVNARDAMLSGGKLVVRTQKVDFDSLDCEKHPGINSGSYVMLIVSDNGVGMAPEVKEHLFEPFFTTKEVGRGTGLGLATIYGIIKQVGGFISVYSEEGKGTVFKVYFPFFSSEPQTTVEKGRIKDELTGSETILVVEDDDVVRGFIRAVLEMYGYIVVSMKNPQEALNYLDLPGNPCDLLVTDMVMPGMNGKELAERACLSRSSLKVIYISGFQEHMLFKKFSDDGIAFLEKPFQQYELLSMVREVLEGKGTNKVGG